MINLRYFYCHQSPAAWRPDSKLVPNLKNQPYFENLEK